MTVDYKKPSLREYKELIRYDAKLTGEIKIAELLNEDLKTVELKQEKKLLGIRIKIIEAAFILKHKWVNKKATA
ncbi:RNA polymerase subunit sigma [Bacillus cereus]|nr:RNA polymerase subunit sigma [Bacillus cereus]